MKARRAALASCLLAGALLAAGTALPAQGAPRAASVPAGASGARAAESCPPQPVPLTQEDVRAGLREAQDSGFLWRATRDGHASYLYATIHAAERAWMFPGPQVMDALRASETVMLELDPTDADTIARLQRALAPVAGDAPLPADLAHRMAAQARVACLPEQVLGSLRPEMGAITLEVLSGRRLGLQPAYGVDAFLAQLTRGAGKPLRALETPEAQAALLVNDDPAVTRRIVREMLEELESGEASRVLVRLAQDWRHGNLEDLADYRAWCDCVKTPEQQRDLVRFIDERNPHMAEQVVRAHAGGKRLFVAVGSLHLVGPRGVPELLRHEGFIVERVHLGP